MFIYTIKARNSLNVIKYAVVVLGRSPVAIRLSAWSANCCITGESTIRKTGSRILLN